jgi:hypothetical protein
MRLLCLPTPQEAEQMPHGDDAQAHDCVLHASVDAEALLPEATHRSFGTPTPATGSTHTVVLPRVPPPQGALQSLQSPMALHSQLAVLQACCVGGWLAAVQSEDEVVEPEGVTQSTARVCVPPGPHFSVHSPHAPARHWFG